MKKEEILEKQYFSDQVIENKSGILKAMDEYGRQCFDAGFKNGYKAAESNDGNENYDDYLKELE